MGTKHLPVCIVFILFLLSGCSAPTGRGISSPQTPGNSLTRTPFLLAGITLSSGSTLTETATRAPVDTATQSLTVNLEAVGDIMLARTVGQQVQSQGPQVVFAGVQTVLDSADVLVGNLECALTSGGSPQPKTFTFAAPPETTKALALAGFDVLSLANNHAMDYGAAGLADTVNNLNQNGIASAGAGMNAAEAYRPVILERNGLRLAFLAYADVQVESSGFDAHAWIATDSQPGIAWADPDQIKADVTAARIEADLVIVLLHSGYEITSIIPNISDDQRLAAHAAIDAGAAVVIGSHPHFLQSIERYHGGLIAYSLGNFVFDDYRGIANETIILRVVLTRAGFQSYEWVPVLIENGLPELTDLNNALAIGTMVAPINP
jgi:poly-gamma-glutamate capsule biosynthesis protein CapA/YwtB (metallophosphatase superfamily)